MKAAIFDIWSDYAHFRKPYTTTSALTFMLPPPTAVAGLVGAIMGIESGGFGRSEHLPYLRSHQGKFAVRLLSQNGKTKLNLNYLKTKDDNKGRSIQVPVELVRKPCYRIYFSAQDDLVESLAELLSRQESKYTPCLGLSELVASFKYVGLYELGPSSLPAQVNSTVPLDYYEVEVEPGKQYLKETQAQDFNDQRQAAGFITIVYERNCQTIKVTASKNDQARLCRLDGPSGEEIIALV